MTPRQYLLQVKNNEAVRQELLENTKFLDLYNVTINERAYHYMNNLIEPLLCPYCKINMRTFSGRFSSGYRPTCKCKECKSKMFSEAHTDNTAISDNREARFLEWEKSVTHVTDSDIKENIKYDKYISKLTNPVIIKFLKNRFKDSDSLLESFQRIQQGIEEKPLCPYCGKPVTWLGKKGKMFTKYCSNTCRANSKETHDRMKATLKSKWGTEGCYDSPKYRAYLKEKIGRETWSTPEVIEKRKQTFKERFGTSKISEIPEILEKVEETNIERYGVPHRMMDDEYKVAHIEKLNSLGNERFATSKEEIKLRDELLKVYPTLIWHKYDKERYPYNVDFYIPEKDLFIEYQGSQYHHYEAYNPENPKHIEELKKLQELAKVTPISRKNSNQYYETIRIWTQKDPEKRKFAKEHNIKLLEIWPHYNLNEVIKQIEEF